VELYIHSPIRLHIFTSRCLLKHRENLTSHNTFVIVGFVTVIMEFDATIANKYTALTSCIGISYVAGHERASTVYRVYSVSIGNISMWIYEM
jgi:hypothetical protein